MERRSALKNLVNIAGGIMILPACSKNKSKASIQLNKLDISAYQERLLAEICETLIPETDSPGSKSLNLHLFVLKMVDDCYEKVDQENFVDGLGKVDKLTRDRFDKSFINCSVDQREEIMKSIESIKGFPEQIYYFYKITKERTIQGYLNSKYVMTEKLKYELVPGRYNGYFPVKKS